MKNFYDLRGVHLHRNCISENGKIARASTHAHTILSTNFISKISIFAKMCWTCVIKGCFCPLLSRSSETNPFTSLSCTRIYVI